MDRTYSAGDCYTDLSFMGVAYDPNCDPALRNFLYDCNDECCLEETCCC
jgi:hypothetical protein